MQLLIEIVVGVFLAIGFVVLVRLTGSYAQELLNLAIGLVVTALIYVGFGVYSGSVGWMFTEVVGVPIYAVFAGLGLRRSGWFLAIGWALHPVWDAALHGYATPFVPHWYIGGCVGFDLLVAGYIGFRELRK
ncbi:MAG TPA: DUF6010 family protein [Pyrinomonadaceae bacterium]|jgi:hypothetical protein|nr:DUF6010 family protein [Pyrinomonadaceae bacterium]